ncbi:hypothetical protein NL676_027942 [Syzygium grande]|nr:hypothetical protein NL676_027942 [Syzygium grande]
MGSFLVKEHPASSMPRLPVYEWQKVDEPPDRRGSKPFSCAVKGRRKFRKDTLEQSRFKSNRRSSSRTGTIYKTIKPLIARETMLVPVETLFENAKNPGLTMISTIARPDRTCRACESAPELVLLHVPLMGLNEKS